jgi:hypothetical protein
MTLVSVLALASVAFLGQASHVSLRGIDSNIHARVAMNVTSAGIRPVLPMPNSNAALDHQVGFKASSSEYFNDHPFPLFWVNGLIMRLLGPDGFSARLLTAAFSVGSVFLIYLIGALLYSEVFGVLAALFLIFTRDFILTSGTFSLDTALVFFILLTFYLWMRKKWLALGLFAGIGLWAKTPMVLLVFPTAFVVGLISGNQKVFRKEVVLLLSASVLALFVGSWVWIYLGVSGGWPVVEDYWVRQLWGTAVGGRGAAAERSPVFFFYTVRTGFLPGLPFLFFAFYRVYRTRAWRKSYFLIPLVATFWVGTVVTLMSFKLGHYYTPIFPFLALIAAYSVVPWVEKHVKGFYRTVQLVSTALFCFLLVTPTELAPEAFVALTKFEAFIQAHGNCQDTVYLVPGEEPVGSTLDYALHLEFYTGRRVKVVECPELEKTLASPAVNWVILGEQNFKKCLSVQAQNAVASRIRMGTQLLLSRLPSGSEFDLTPLVVERQAVTDCKAPPYPQDRWHRYSTGQY